MTALTPPQAPKGLRVATSVGLILVWVSMATAILTAGPARVRLVHPLVLVAILLALVAWNLFSTGVNLLIDVAILLALQWAWAVSLHPLIQADTLALLTLLAVAVLQRRRQSRRVHTLQQKLEDVAEEQTLKARAIESAKQVRDGLRKKLSRYARLQAIAEELSNMTEFGSIAHLVVDRAFELIGKSDVCLLYLLNHDRQELSLCASKKQETLSAIRAKHGDQFDRHVLRTHRPLLVNDLRRDFRFTVTTAAERPVRAVIASPLFLGAAPEGVLRLDSAEPSVYTQDDVRFVEILLDLVAAAATNARLFAQTQQLAMTDGLTGLTLRRPFLEQLTRELTRSGRSRCGPVTLLMMDIDHFKRFNDTYGHTAGDVILKSFAEVLRTVIPPGSMIARYGGEEFAVLLPRTDRAHGVELAENIRQLTEQQIHVAGRSRLDHGDSAESAPPAKRRDRGTRHGESEHVVTVSIGVAAFPEDAQAELELIRVADQRLYHAKRAGRNRVVATGNHL